MRIAVNGAAGRMGRLLVDQVLEAPDLQLSGRGEQASPLSPAELEDSDVVVDFSLPAGTHQLLGRLGEQALVIGTTGLDEPTLALLAAHAERAPVVFASNFSTGVNLLFGLAAQAAAALPDHHVEVVEMHHARKRDAPSGTALSLGRAIAEARGQALEGQAVHGRAGEVGARSPTEIGFHALRGGDVAGEHTVYLAGPGERLSLGHLATSRQGFASGALRAARWTSGQPPGLYDMQDVLGLTR
jgi:4-hydroxy-tetrahydrodipicolinate reductase